MAKIPQKFPLGTTYLSIRRTSRYSDPYPLAPKLVDQYQSYLSFSCPFYNERYPNYSWRDASQYDYPTTGQFVFTRWVYHHHVTGVFPVDGIDVFILCRMVNEIPDDLLRILVIVPDDLFTVRCEI